MARRVLRLTGFRGTVVAFRFCVKDLFASLLALPPEPKREP